MPKLTKQLPEGYEAVSRPIARGMISSIIKHLGIGDKYYVQFGGDLETSPLPGSLLSDPVKNEGNTRFTQSQKVSVSLKEDFIEQEVLATPVARKNVPEVFIDAPLDVTLKPVYHLIEGVLSFTYRAADQTSAEQWLKGLVRHISQGRKELYEEICYEYPIPREFVAVLREIHRLRESNAGYGDSLGDWLRGHMTDRATVITTMAGKEPLLVIKEVQKGVIGWFDWTIPPTPEKADDGATYTASFEYHYQYEQVTGVHLSYPIMIHQQLLDAKWCPRNTPYEMWRQPAYMSLAKSMYESHKNVPGGYIETMEGVVYPEYDEWIPYNVPANTLKLFSALLSVDATDPTLVVNLHDLLHWELNPIVLDYLLANREWITKHHFSPVIVSLYVDKDRYDETTLTIDADGSVRTSAPMDSRKQYHFVIHAMLDLSQLTRERQDVLRTYPAACLTFLTALDPVQAASGRLPSVIGNRLVNRREYLEFVARIATTSVIFRTANEYGRFTVGTYFLQTHKGVEHGHR